MSWMNKRRPVASSRPPSEPSPVQMFNPNQQKNPWQQQQQPVTGTHSPQQQQQQQQSNWYSTPAASRNAPLHPTPQQQNPTLYGSSAAPLQHYYNQQQQQNSNLQPTSRSSLPGHYQYNNNDANNIQQQQQQQQQNILHQQQFRSTNAYQQQPQQQLSQQQQQQHQVGGGYNHDNAYQQQPQPAQLASYGSSNQQRQFGLQNTTNDSAYNNPTQGQNQQPITAPASDTTSTTTTTIGDAWSSWNWGADEDNSNNVQQQQQPATNQTDSWNWSVPQQPQQQAESSANSNAEQVMQHQQQHAQNLSGVGSRSDAVATAAVNNTSGITSSSTGGPIIRNKLGTTTPHQWSVESQLSQESSDDVLQTSESDKSHMLSRSSTISHSPVSGQDSLVATATGPLTTTTIETSSAAAGGAGGGGVVIGNQDDNNPASTSVIASAGHHHFENDFRYNNHHHERSNQNQAFVDNTGFAIIKKDHDYDGTDSRYHPDSSAATVLTSNTDLSMGEGAVAASVGGITTGELAQSSGSSTVAAATAINSGYGGGFENEEIVSSRSSQGTMLSSERTPPPPPLLSNTHTPPPPPPRTASGGGSEDLTLLSTASLNPYKRNATGSSGVGGTGLLSHKTANKFAQQQQQQQLPLAANAANHHQQPQLLSQQNLYQQQQQQPQSVNLETVPDNSEQPDSMMVGGSLLSGNIGSGSLGGGSQLTGGQVATSAVVRKTSSTAQPLPHQIWGIENNEAPTINDRNQYLETGQLSDLDLNNTCASHNQHHDQHNTGSSSQLDLVDTLPPPGLSRMVPGQLEQYNNNNINTKNVSTKSNHNTKNTNNRLLGQSTDDGVGGGMGSSGVPPPGFRRMVPGGQQTEASGGGGNNSSAASGLSAIISSDSRNNHRHAYDTSAELPEGLRRMIPGESSSPESSATVVAMLRQQQNQQQQQQQQQLLSSYQLVNQVANGSNVVGNTGSSSRLQLHKKLKQHRQINNEGRQDHQDLAPDPDQDYDEVNYDDDDTSSEPEMAGLLINQHSSGLGHQQLPRSATIGADTPPPLFNTAGGVTSMAQRAQLNRAEITIGADTSSDHGNGSGVEEGLGGHIIPDNPGSVMTIRGGAASVSSSAGENRSTGSGNVGPSSSSSANLGKKSKKATLPHHHRHQQQQGQRRDSVEGQLSRDSDLANLATRNLNIATNTGATTTTTTTTDEHRQNISALASDSNIDEDEDGNDSRSEYEQEQRNTDEQFPEPSSAAASRHNRRHDNDNRGSHGNDNEQQDSSDSDRRHHHGHHGRSSNNNKHRNRSSPNKEHSSGHHGNTVDKDRDRRYHSQMPQNNKEDSSRDRNSRGAAGRYYSPLPSPIPGDQQQNSSSGAPLTGNNSSRRKVASRDNNNISSSGRRGYDDAGDTNEDYFSDKERERRYRDQQRRDKDAGRDYDRKYGSLRKDKDGRRQRRGGDDVSGANTGNRRLDETVGSSSRRGDYGRSNYHDYENEPRSRASSRSDSHHEGAYSVGSGLGGTSNVRDRDRDRRSDKDRRDRDHNNGGRQHRDKERHGRHHHHHGRDRDRHRNEREAVTTGGAAGAAAAATAGGFNPYYGPQAGYMYDVYGQYYQQYQYYENLRKTNPQAYAQFYRKYYQDAAAARSAGDTPSYGGVSGGAEDRASVHSGRSSAQEELLANKDSFNRTFDQTDNSITNYEEDSSLQLTQVQRLTPAKFATAHIKASISSGKLVKILPHYPLDGQNAIVEVCNLESLLRNDPDYQELKQFPGPLTKGVTHKKTIIEYCENKIKGASLDVNLLDPESYVLMWELLILLIRQNGTVVGTDIAELLLKNHSNQESTLTNNRPSSVASSSATGGSNNNQAAISENIIPDANNQAASTNDGANSANRNNNYGTGSASNLLKVGGGEEEVTNKFREYLLYGSGKEALEWAMKHGLWGHALFLASKLDKRTYANVLMRFANGLTMNDPLQTLYQLLSGKVPAAVTCVADEKWGDWRPHLAMILSNSSHRPELNCKAIAMLGDTLLNRGSLYAAQFCYLMAEVGFGKHDDNPEARLVLLGADHRYRGNDSNKISTSDNVCCLSFATNEAIHMTEIYEYACSLNAEGFALAEFQRYKYLLATRLADMGLLEKSLAYLEKLANFIVKRPSEIESWLINRVGDLADRLKYHDPVGDAYEEEEEEDVHNENGGGLNLDTSRPDNSWLRDLRAVQQELGSLGEPSQFSNILGATTSIPAVPADQIIPGQDDSSLLWQQNPQQQQQQHYGQYPQQWAGEQQQQQQQTQVEPHQSHAEYGLQSAQAGEQQIHSEGYNTSSAAQYQDQQQNYWSNQQQQQQPSQWSPDQQQQLASTGGAYNNQDSASEPQNYYGSSNMTAQSEEIPSLLLQQQPQISLPNQIVGKSTAYEDESTSTQKDTGNSVAKSKNENDAVQQQKTQQQSGNAAGGGNGWFGGIFSKLSLKPKNQMKLPDDKNPSIVWDPDKKRWINTHEDTGDASNEFKPPPKMADLMTRRPRSQPTVAPSPAQQLGGNQQQQQTSFNNPYYNSHNISSSSSYNTNGNKSGDGAPSMGASGQPDSNPLDRDGGKPPLPNMFKLQRSRNLKKSYIDVFNPNSAGAAAGGGKSSSQLSSNMSVAGATTHHQQQQQMNFFVPQPVNDPNAPTDFLTPAPPLVQSNETNQ